ncbi:MAG: nucleotidyltransferase family protein [Clostridia bacterium]|nr:nucleotidyltransferase family protein [Clostridia bacterium]
MDGKRFTEEALTERLLGDGEIALLRQLFAEENDAAELRRAAEGIDLDTVPVANQLALARLSFKAGKDGLPSSVVPRVRGVYRYYQAQLAFRAVWFSEKLRLLNEHGIPVLLLKGMAMYLHFDPGQPRTMGDTDIAVPADRYQEAKRLLCGSGLMPKPVPEAAYSVDLYEGDPEHRGKGYYELDLHHRVFKWTDDARSGVWDRVREASVRGQKAYVLSTLDMLMALIDNDTRCLFDNESPGRHLKWLMDIRLLLSREDAPTPERIRERAEELGEGYRVRLMLRLVLRAFPDVFPEEAFERCFPDDEGYRKWLRAELGYHALLTDPRWAPSEEGTRLGKLPVVFRRMRLDYLRYRLDRCPAPFHGVCGYLKFHYRADGFGEMAKKTLRRLKLR